MVSKRRIIFRVTQDRHNALKTALYEHIEQKKFSDDVAVLAWLITSLDEWVERLEGTFSWGRIEQTDFFRGLMTNIEMIDEVKSRWEFKELARRVLSLKARLRTC